MADDPIQLQFEFPDNTGPLTQSWQTLGAISKDIREDWKVVGDELQTTIDRADELRSKLSLNKELLDGMKDVLGLINSSLKDNDAVLQNSLQMINQILQGSRNVGMNIAQAQQTAGAAEGFTNPLSNPMAFQAYANQMRQVQNDPFYTGQGSHSQFSDPNQVEYFENRNRILPSAEEVGGVVNGGHGEDPLKKWYGPSDQGIPSSAANETGSWTSGRTPGPSESIATVNRYGNFNVPAGAPNVDMSMYGNLPSLQSFKNKAQFLNAPTAAINDMGAVLQASPAAQIPGMSTLMNMFTGVLQGINKMAAGGYGGPASGTGQGEYFNQLQQTLMNFANNLVGNIVKGTSGTSGFGGAVATTGGIFSIGQSLYGGLKDLSQKVRSQSYNVQAFGDIYGTVDPALYAQERLAAAAYNIQDRAVYGSKDALASIYAATQLGLKGGAVTNYQNLDYTLQTQYGLSHGETQQLMSTGLAYGIDLNTLTSGYEQARRTAAATDTSTAYASQTYQTGAATAASLGFNSKVAAAMGNNAVNFGAGNQIAQNAGMTGQELMGTQLGTALFAQAAGVPFMSVYQAAAGMTSQQASTYESKAMMGLLQNLGINPNTIKQQSDLNQYAIKLGIILPQLGVTDVTTPQQAVTWTWQTILQSRGLNSSTMTTGGTTTSKSSALAGQGVPATAAAMLSSSDTSNFGQALANSGLSSSTLGTATSSSATTVQISFAPGVQNIISAVVQQQQSAATSPSANPPLANSGA